MDNDAPQDEITAFWNRVAPHYDSPGNVATPGTDEYDHWRESLRAILPAPPAQVLDVGTGTGFLARLAAELGHDVTAIDLAERMIDASSTRDAAGISFAIGDAVAPAFPAQSFDAVCSRSLVWTLREPEGAFRSWWALLRPGGRVIAIFGLIPAGVPPGQGPYTAATRAHLPAMHLTDHEFLLQAASAAGFSEVRVTPLDLLHGWETSPGSDLPYALIGHRS